MRFSGIVALALAVLLPDAVAPLDFARAEQDKKKPAIPAMDFGPYLSCAVMSKPNARFDNNTGSFDGDVTARGFLVKLADDWSAGVVFDSDNLRLSAGWMDAPVK